LLGAGDRGPWVQTLFYEMMVVTLEKH
jgi:hypothetical protein